MKDEPLKLQHKLCLLDVERSKISTFANCSIANQAIWNSLSLPGAADFLNVIPTEVDLKMSDSEFLDAIRKLLLLPHHLEAIAKGSMRCSCSHSPPLDEFHAETCKQASGKRSGVIFRHDGIQDLHVRLFREGNMWPQPSKAGETGVTKMNGKLSRKRGDIILFQGNSVQSVSPKAIDFSVVHPGRQALLPKTSKEPGAACHGREKEKNAKHAEAYGAIRMSFIPAVFEVYGGISSSWVQWLHLFCLENVHWPYGPSSWSASSPFVLFKQRLSVFFHKERSRRVRNLFAKVSNRR